MFLCCLRLAAYRSSSTLAACNLSRDSNTLKPFLCTKCGVACPTMSFYNNHSWQLHLIPTERRQWESLAAALITPHDLLWYHTQQSLTLTPLPTDAHGLATLPHNIRPREDNSYNPLVNMAPYKRSILTTSTSQTPTLIEYPYLTPSDVYQHAKSLRKLYLDNISSVAIHKMTGASHPTSTTPSDAVPPVDAASSTPSGAAPPADAVPPAVSSPSVNLVPRAAATSPFGTNHPKTIAASPTTLRPVLKAAPQPSPFGRSQSAAPVVSRSQPASGSASSNRPQPPLHSPHNHSYNTCPSSVPSTNEDLTAFLFNPFNLPLLISYHVDNSSNYFSCGDTLTYHNWCIDSSQLDLSLFKFVVINTSIHNTFFQNLDCIKHSYQRLFICLPTSYFLLYQFAFHSFIVHVYSLQVCICNALNCQVPPHVHFVNHQCQRILFILANVILDPDLPVIHLHLFYAIFIYSTTLITAKVIFSSYLLYSPLLPSGATPSSLKESHREDMLKFFNSRERRLPAHVRAHTL